jgi:predicted transcriptional regulator
VKLESELREAVLAFLLTPEGQQHSWDIRSLGRALGLNPYRQAHVLQEAVRSLVSLGLVTRERSADHHGAAYLYKATYLSTQPKRKRSADKAPDAPEA